MADKSKSILLTFDQLLRPPASTGIVDPTSFVVTSLSELHVGANFYVAVTHTVQSVVILNNTVELKLLPTTRLKNPKDTVRVQYTLSKGLILGAAQPLRNFDVTFLPVDLLKVPNPIAKETVSTAISSLDITLSKIHYVSSNVTEQVNTTLSDLSIILTKVGSLPL